MKKLKRFVGEASLAVRMLAFLVLIAALPLPMYFPLTSPAQAGPVRTAVARAPATNAVITPDPWLFNIHALLSVLNAAPAPPGPR